MSDEPKSDVPATSPAPAESEPPRPSAMNTWANGLIAAGLLCIALFLGIQEAKEKALLPVKQAAPLFTMQRHGGGSVSLANLRGKVVMLDFWATWCPPCIEEMPWLVKVAAEYKSKGVEFVAAADDDVDTRVKDVTDFIERRVPELAAYAAYNELPIAYAYKIKSLPTLYIINRAGEIVESTSGLTSEWRVRKWLDAAVAEPAP